MTDPQPSAFTASQPQSTLSAFPASNEKPATSNVKGYVTIGIIVALVLFLAYQQIQISKLTSDLSTVSDSVKSSDVRTRLETQEQSLGELNTRLAYLDSKINATDQKAQEALNRIKAHEDNDIIGNMVKGLKQTLGIK